jgi:hypothetical protein
MWSLDLSQRKAFKPLIFGLIFKKKNWVLQSRYLVGLIVEQQQKKNYLYCKLKRNYHILKKKQPFKFKIGDFFIWKEESGQQRDDSRTFFIPT